MKWPLWRRRQDAQLDEELRSHLELAIQDRIDRGESPEQAAAAARREFGNVLLVRETVRDTWGWTPIQHFWQDLRLRAPRAVEGARVHHRRGPDARPRHRRQRRDVQRGARRGAAAAAVCRARTAGGGQRNRSPQRRSAAALGVVAGLLRLAPRYADARVDVRSPHRQLHRDRSRAVAARAGRGGLGEPVFDSRRGAVPGPRLSRGRGAGRIGRRRHQRRVPAGLPRRCGESGRQRADRQWTPLHDRRRHPAALQLPRVVSAGRDLGDDGRGRARRNARRHANDRAARRAFHPSGRPDASGSDLDERASRVRRLRLGAGEDRSRGPSQPRRRSSHRSTTRSSAARASRCCSCWRR